MLGCSRGVCSLSVCCALTWTCFITPAQLGLSGALDCSRYRCPQHHLPGCSQLPASQLPAPMGLPEAFRRPPRRFQRPPRAPRSVQELQKPSEAPRGPQTPPRGFPEAFSRASQKPPRSLPEASLRPPRPNGFPGADLCRCNFGRFEYEIANTQSKTLRTHPLGTKLCKHHFFNI